MRQDRPRRTPRSTPAASSAQRTVAMIVEYDGTDFVGSQWQTNGRSVQAALEEAWQGLTQERQRMALSGRTDAGVHALGQVASITTGTTHAPDVIVRGMNAHLPEDVAIRWAWNAPAGFHARHSATRRDYRYLIDPTPVGSPMLRRHVWHVGRRLHVAAMNEALATLIGRHDFAAFAAAGATDGSTVRTCYVAQCLMVREFNRELIAIEIAANAFLHHMVRNIVGTAVLAGEGRLDATGFAAILAGGDRRKAGRTAPAHGLTLMSVTYPETGDDKDAAATEPQSSRR